MDHRPPAARRRLSHQLSDRADRGAGRAGEDGVIVVLTAISIVAVLLVATIVIDASMAYPQRRSMQNAADAAAVAGSRQLDKVKYHGASWSTVAATVSSIVDANGADASTCTIIGGTGTAIGPCSSYNAVTAASAAGVRVVAEDSRRTTFGRLAGRDQVTAKAEAAATIQALRGTGVPFVVCGNPLAGGYPILNPDNTINVQTATAMGTIDIQSAQVPGCGAGSAFKGKIGDDEVVTPGWVTGDNGNGFDQQIQADVLGATPCPTGGPFTGCDMLVPIANKGTGNGNDIHLYVVAWAVFHITGDGHGNPKYQGQFRADAPYASGGATSTDLPGDGVAPRVIRLIE